MSFIKLNNCRMEGKQLWALFSRCKSQTDKHIAQTTEEANRASENKKNHNKETQAARETLNKNIDFTTCPAQNDFQPIVKRTSNPVQMLSNAFRQVDHFISCQKDSQFSESDVIRIRRNLELLQLKEETTLAVFLRYTQVYTYASFLFYCKYLN
jgi:hypothetical protein